MRLPELADIRTAMQAGRSITRIQLAPPAAGVPAQPLIAGTEKFASEDLVRWHHAAAGGHARDVACYIVGDAVVTGAGQVWIGGRLVTSPEIMPPYVATALGIAEGGAAILHHCARLPVRGIDAPCLVALGSATENYGHFLVEILFRLLMARQASAVTGVQYRVLLDHAAPAWLLGILEEYFDIPPARIELFDPWRERVLLHEALVPARIFQDPAIHPFANHLIDRFIGGIGIDAAMPGPKRIFVARNQMRNPTGFHRRCMNEGRLMEIAAGQFGFAPICPETLPWRQQIAIFRGADIIAGQAGSALHNALFSAAGSRLASIGLINLIQSEIGALRQQHMAFLLKDVSLSGEFTIDENLFSAFLDVVCRAPAASSQHSAR